MDSRKISLRNTTITFTARPNVPPSEARVWRCALFLALLNPRDQDHIRAKKLASQWKGEIVTTRWVLAEVADGLSAPNSRGPAAAFLQRLEKNSFVRIVPSEDAQFVRGLELYSRRSDKAWSLTDCISFVVMQDEKLNEALTGDRHFEQAGFKALLAVK